MAREDKSHRPIVRISQPTAPDLDSTCPSARELTRMLQEVGVHVPRPPVERLATNEALREFERNHPDLKSGLPFKLIGRVHGQSGVADAATFIDQSGEWIVTLAQPVMFRLDGPALSRAVRGLQRGPIEREVVREAADLRMLISDAKAIQLKPLR